MTNDCLLPVYDDGIRRCCNEGIFMFCSVCLFVDESREGELVLGDVAVLAEGRVRMYVSVDDEAPADNSGFVTEFALLRLLQVGT
jgi:hypothetical protein